MRGFVAGVVVSIMLWSPASAHADKPSVADVQAAAKQLRDAFDDDHRDPKLALAVLSAPLWFDGIKLTSSDSPLRKRCGKKHRGTLSTAKLIEGFLDCLAASDWSYSIDGPDGEFEPVDLKHLPSVFRKHKSKLQKLAKDHTLAVTHFCPAAPGDFWTLYAATKDDAGRTHIDALLVFNEEDGECRMK